MGSEETVDKLLKNIRNSNGESKNNGKKDLSTKTELSTRNEHFSYNEKKKSEESSD